MILRIEWEWNKIYPTITYFASPLLDGSHQTNYILQFLWQGVESGLWHQRVDFLPVLLSIFFLLLFLYFELLTALEERVLAETFSFCFYIAQIVLTWIE